MVTIKRLFPEVNLYQIWLFMNNYFKLSHQQQLSAHTQIQLNSQDSRTLNRSRKMMQLAAESLSRIGTYQIFIA